MKKLWKIIKENITVVLAMTTAFLSVVYAGIRLMIYVYWMGYFKELNIDANVMNISKRQIMRLVELTFLCQTLKNTKKLIVF